MWSGPMTMWWMPGRHERRQHRRGARPGAGVVVHRRPPRVEDRLVPQRAVLVDVDERLVQRVVGEQRRVDRRRAPGGRATGAASANRSACRSGIGVRSDSATGDGTAVDRAAAAGGREARPARRRAAAAAAGSSSARASASPSSWAASRSCTVSVPATRPPSMPQVEEAEGRRMRGGDRGPADERGHQHQQAAKQATTGERRRHRVRRLRDPGRPGSRSSAMSSRGRRSAAASRRPGSRECRRSNQGGRRASGAADA